MFVYGIKAVSISQKWTRYLQIHFPDCVVNIPLVKHFKTNGWQIFFYILKAKYSITAIIRVRNFKNFIFAYRTIVLLQTAKLLL